MRFVETGLPGAVLLEPERSEDDRGYFARAFDRAAFAAHGLVGDYPEHSLSFNRRRGTLRGLHYQRTPHEEAKVVRCTRGAVYDVAADVRPGSATFGCWTSVELSAANGRALYVAPGLAHGFQTLTDDAELYYLISVAYEPSAAAGVRWDDPDLAIQWPLEVSAISERDRGLPPLAG